MDIKIHVHLFYMIYIIFTYFYIKNDKNSIKKINVKESEIIPAIEEKNTEVDTEIVTHSEESESTSINEEENTEVNDEEVINDKETIEVTNDLITTSETQGAVLEPIIVNQKSKEQPTLLEKIISWFKEMFGWK